VATVGNKILFAGGGDNDNGATTTRVDIYDALNNTWSTAELSQGREYFAAATLGEKVFFAGGRTWQTSPSGFSTWATSSVVDIYDNASNTWTTATLSESRSDLSATTIDNKIYFAGGFSDQFQQIPTTAWIFLMPAQIPGQHHG
jgi:N-acetylneuraminic acid mutarotase